MLTRARRPYAQRICEEPYFSSIVEQSGQQRLEHRKTETQKEVKEDAYTHDIRTSEEGLFTLIDNLHRPDRLFMPS